MQLRKMACMSAVANDMVAENVSTDHIIPPRRRISSENLSLTDVKACMSSITNDKAEENVSEDHNIPPRRRRSSKNIILNGVDAGKENVSEDVIIPPRRRRSSKNVSLNDMKEIIPVVERKKRRSLNIDSDFLRGIVQNISDPQSQIGSESDSDECTTKLKGESDHTIPTELESSDDSIAEKNVGCWI